MKPSRKQITDAARRYVKLVEWSDEDQCYIGSAPPLIGQSCHGPTESAVIQELTQIVEEWVEIMMTQGKPLPVATANKTFSGKFLVRVPPEVHKRAALKAAARGDSLNQFVSDILASA